MAGDFRGRSILSSGGVTLVGIIAWNVGNFAFFVLAARAVGPREFGLVAALLAISVAALVPCGAIQASVGRSVARDPTGRHGLGRKAFITAVCWASLAGVVGLAGIGVAVAVAGDIPSWELVITLVTLLPLVPFHVSLGTLQGRHRFGAAAFCLATLGLVRPILLPILDLGVGGGFAALGAGAGSVIAAALLAAVLTARDWRERRAPDGATWLALLASLVAPVAGLVGVGLLVSTDVVVSKLALDDADAGHFGAIAPLGKTAVMIVPMAIAFVLLPRVARLRADGRDTGKLLGLGIGVALGAGGLLLLVVAPLAHQIVRIFGSDYAPASDLLLPVLAASIPIGVLVVLVNHHIALGGRRFLWVVLGVGLAALPAFGIWHSSARMLLAVDAVAAVAGILLHEVIYGRKADGVIRGLARLMAAQLGSARS